MLQDRAGQHKVKMLTLRDLRDGRFMRQCHPQMRWGNEVIVVVDNNNVDRHAGSFCMFHPYGMADGAVAPPKSSTEIFGRLRASFA